MKRPIAVLPPRPGMGDTFLLHRFDRTKRHLPDLAVDEYLSPKGLREIERVLKNETDKGLIARRVSMPKPHFDAVIRLVIRKVRLDIAFVPTVCGLPLQPHDNPNQLDSITVHTIDPRLLL